MPYASSEELAAALNITVTAANATVLEACLESAAVEIDHHLTTDGILPSELPPGLLNRTNINRAVEWFKAPSAYNNGVGYVDVGLLSSATGGSAGKQPPSGFERHAATLLPYKTSWGLA